MGESLRLCKHSVKATILIMKLHILFFFCALSLCLANPRSGRTRRDLTCAAGGTRLCNFRCKGVGRADGTCVWNTETGAYNCECAEERRGIRCNLGGENTCYYSCKALGYRNGMCDAQDNCECGGGNNRWGEIIENVRDRL